MSIRKSFVVIRHFVYLVIKALLLCVGELHYELQGQPVKAAKLSSNLL